MIEKSVSPILTLSCPDSHGIVAAVAEFLAAQGCNIENSDQHADHDTDLFFMRVEFSLGEGSNLEAIEKEFAPIAAARNMDARFYDAAAPIRAVIMASKGDHCLLDLLHRVKRRELNLDVRSVVSNHQSAAETTAPYETPFVHLPVSDANRADQEQRLLEIIEQENAELVILARYMQILSDGLCEKLQGRAINIHHSFLPSFKGARPYHQAYARGVKLIGATAHFVSADLDEGPIIEQEAERVDHARNVADFIRIGRDVERRTLAQAVRLYCERRVLPNGVRTVVFR